MISPNPHVGVDVGLLAPVRAGAAGLPGLDDAAFAQAMLDVERAWVGVCARFGLVDVPAAQEDPSGPWDVGRYDLASVGARTALGGNALIPLLADLRAALRADGRDVEAAAVHLGATSQDVIDTALMLLAARTLDAALPRLAAGCDGLAALARAHRADVAVARSLGQHALPTTLGARAGAWLDGLSAAGADLAAVRAELPAQWAGAAGTSAALIDRIARERGCGTTEAVDVAREMVAALAARLGLAAAPGWHTARRPVWRLGGALAGVVAAAGTLGTDVVTASRREIGEAAEPSAPGRGGSSAMPHKRNPVLSVLLRSAALTAPGHVATLFAAAGDADDERPTGAWHAEWAALRELLRLLAGVAPIVAELGAGLTLDAGAARRNLGLSMPAVLTERVIARLRPLVADADALRRTVDDALAQGFSDPGRATPILLGAIRGLVDADALPDAALDDLLDPLAYVGDAPRAADDAAARHEARRAGAFLAPQMPPMPDIPEDR